MITRDGEANMKNDPIKSGWSSKNGFMLEHEFESSLTKEPNTFYNAVKAAYAEAMREGIKANTIVINDTMVRVRDEWIPTPGGARCLPKMICGLNVYLTKDELPENYSFAVLEGPSDRLAQFESIGMEPAELRKAAELYRRIKECME
jgi:hypothetical protein